MKLLEISVGIIGSGNMGGAIAGGIAASGMINKADIFVADSNNAKAKGLAKKYGISVGNNVQIASQCHICMIAVKPDVAHGVIKSIASFLKPHTIVMSIVAGLDVATAEKLIGKNYKFIRVMPNTPALVGEGMTAISPGSAVSDEDMSLAEYVLSCIGKVVTVDENKMDAVTGLSGSGPAYIFQIIEAMSDGGVFAGLPRDKAIQMAAQTVLGSAKMVLETGLHPAVLKDMVTSPAGTTIEGVLAMEKGGVRKSIMEAVIAGVNKSKLMSRKNK